MDSVSLDEFMQEATQVRRTQGYRAAVMLLMDTSVTQDMSGGQLLLLCKKLIPYALKTPDFDLNNILKFVRDNQNKEGNLPSDIVGFHLEIASFLNKLKKYDDAVLEYKAGLSKLHPAEHQQYFQLLQPLLRGIADTMPHASKPDLHKASEYLYHHLSHHLSILLWHLYVDGCMNFMKLYSIQNGAPQNFTFTEFSMFKNFAAELDEDEDLCGVFTEQVVSYLTLVNPAVDPLKASNYFNECAYHMTPTKLNFRSEFFEDGFSDFNAFALAFANDKGEVDFNYSFPSRAAVTIDEVVNKYLFDVKNNIYE